MRRKSEAVGGDGTTPLAGFHLDVGFVVNININKCNISSE